MKFPSSKWPIPDDDNEIIRKENLRMKAARMVGYQQKLQLRKLHKPKVNAFQKVKEIMGK